MAPTRRSPGTVRAAYRKLYQLPAVRRRMWEYLGGTSAADATAFYLSGGRNGLATHVVPRPPSALGDLLREGLEIGRSLWDGASLLAHLDLEYVHFDRPDEPYDDPLHAFGTQRIVVDVLLSLLHELGIDPLHLWTGRGHHLVWRLARGSRAFDRLRRLGGDTGVGVQVDAAAESAHAGLGLVLEWLGHQTLHRAAAATPVPIQLAAVEVGPGPRGREIVSVDLSQFGDPLYVRTIRLPFSAYLKAHPTDHGGGPRLVAVPARDGEDGPRATRSLETAGEWAAQVSTSIPDCSAGTSHLIAAYLESPLAAFHREYHSHPAQVPPHALQPASLAGLPPCIRFLLEDPNDVLLRPAAIQQVVRAFLSLGWHPRQISGLIRQCYEADFGWSPDLHFRRADLRADFYTRLFAALVETGGDRLIDFNCRSTQEKGFCPGGHCTWNLLDLKEPLLSRLRETG